MKQYLINSREHFRGTFESSVTEHNGQYYVDYSGSLYNDGGDNLTIDQYRSRVNPDAKMITSAEADQLVNEYISSLLTEPEAIDQDRFYDMLEILPPQRWHNCGGFEVFHIQEHLYDALVVWFAHRNGKYWEFTDYDYVSDDHLVKKLSGIAS